MTPEENKEKPTSDFLAMVIIQQKNSSIAVGEIKNALHERGFGILMAIAAIPICLPIPAPPGYTTLFSLPLFIFSLQMIFGMHAPWLPEWLERKSIEKTILEKMLIKADPWLKKIEKYMKPRLTYIAASTWERFIGIFAFVFAISIALRHAGWHGRYWCCYNFLTDIVVGNQYAGVFLAINGSLV